LARHPVAAQAGKPVGQGQIKLSARVSMGLTAGFKAVEQNTRNLTELVQQQNGQQLARVAITTEPRKDHAESIRRLVEIANEADGKRTFTRICGWPALERVYRVRLASVEAEGKKVRKPFEPAATDVQAVTIAVAEADEIVRFEGVLQPGAGAEDTIPIFGLARGISCPANPHPAATKRAIDQLKLEPLRSPSGNPNRQNPVSKESKPPRARASGARPGANPQNAHVQPGIGEVQIAVSREGRNVVIGANSGTSFSGDFGASFNRSNVAIPFDSDGDPTVGTGASGTFYQGFVGYPDGSNAAGGVNGCAASVVASTDNGQNFNFVGHAAFCPLTGMAICFPDQPQMAVDSRNATPSGDQLYMVWRNFPNPGNLGNAGQCKQINRGGPTPTVSCSVDGGRTWQHKTAVGMGDLGRVTVGSDGFVYVTFVAGGNLMFSKFSSCADGLNVQRGFPVMIAAFRGVSCPIPGLDRCAGAGDASPQPAAVSRDFSDDIFVAYAETRDDQSDDIVVRVSHDGGSTWPDRTVANDGTAAGRRFLPWICTSGGAAQVTWYDRRAATAAHNDLTSYFWNRVYAVSFGSGPSRLIAGNEVNVSGSADPQCSTGFAYSVDAVGDATSCQPPPTSVPGACRNAMGGGSQNGCDLLQPRCPQGETCQPGGGEPKYGDYNGNGCGGRRVYMAWASATKPAGVAGAPAGINVYSNALSDTLPAPPPAVTAVAPNLTPCGSGTQVILTGTNFIDVTDVGLFDANGVAESYSLSFTVNSNAQITATIPDTVVSGSYDMVVRTPQGTSIRVFNGPPLDRFMVTPIVDGINPGSGPPTGNTEVTVSGRCFHSDMRVYFGTIEAAKGFDQCASDTQCIVYSPAVAGVGGADVVASVAGAKSAINPNAHFSYDGPKINGISPPSGPLTGGTWVEITGSGFPAYDGVTPLNTPVSFGGAQAMAQCNVSACSVVTPPTAQAGPVHVVATAFGAASTPSSAGADLFTYNQFPALIKFQLPDSFFGVEAAVFLDGNAPAGNAVIDLASSDSSVVAVQTPVTILAGAQFAPVTLTFFPTPRAETVTLTATYRGSSVSASLNIGAAPPLSLAIDAAELGRGESALVTVSLNAPAVGDAMVALSSSDSSAVAVPMQVIIPAGSYQKTFTITNQYSGRPKSVTITATYNGASASDSLLVPTPPPRHCTPQRCAKGSFWNQDDCRCEPGQPQ
jgi:hypothetical protein